MEVRIETDKYNERRYGRPWIAKVDFSKSKKGEFHWGDWVGDHRNGGEGVLVIEANPGDIVAQGQKDRYKPRNSAPDFYAVKVDGSLSPLGDKGAAYKYFLEDKKQQPDRKALEAEKEHLLARLQEIELLLAGNRRAVEI